MSTPQWYYRFMRLNTDLVPHCYNQLPILPTPLPSCGNLSPTAQAPLAQQNKDMPRLKKRLWLSFMHSTSLTNFSSARLMWLFSPPLPPHHGVYIDRCIKISILGDKSVYEIGACYGSFPSFAPLQFKEIVQSLWIFWCYSHYGKYFSKCFLEPQRLLSRRRFDLVTVCWLDHVKDRLRYELFK